MSFDSLADFFAMGGYAVFVWTSYGLAALGAGGLVWAVLSWRRSALDQHAELTRLAEANGLAPPGGDGAETRASQR